jgi:signal transduction histidine kinase
VSARRSAALRGVAGSLGIVAAAAAVAAAIVAIPYGGHAAWETGELVVICGGLGLALAHIAAGWRRHLGGLRRQFAFGAAVAVGMTLAAVIVGAERMFVSNHDATVVSAIVIGAAVVAVRAAQLLSAGVVRDIDAVRSGLAAVGGGARDVRVPAGGRDQVAELAGEVERMIERLSAEEQRRANADRARRDLVAAVSHDLRTPIASLRLLTEAVDDGIVEGETRARYLAEMQTHIQALSVMIDDLFELSRLEAGDVEWSLQRVELSALVDETVAAMRPQADARRVAVDAQVPPELASDRADPARLQRVLFNLIQNAIHHTPADGSVTVRAEQADGAVEIEVADTGAGIPESDRARVFEPFVRGGADAARTSAGAGLGLAIARAIVEGHGGRIWLVEAERGTRIRFSLPSAAERSGSVVSNA